MPLRSSSGLGAARKGEARYMEVTIAAEVMEVVAPKTGTATEAAIAVAVVQMEVTVSGTAEVVSSHNVSIRNCSTLRSRHSNLSRSHKSNSNSSRRLFHSSRSSRHSNTCGSHAISINSRNISSLGYADHRSVRDAINSSRLQHAAPHWCLCLTMPPLHLLRAVVDNAPRRSGVDLPFTITASPHSTRSTLTIWTSDASNTSATRAKLAHHAPLHESNVRGRYDLIENISIPSAYLYSAFVVQNDSFSDI